MAMRQAWKPTPMRVCLVSAFLVFVNAHPQIARSDCEDVQSAFCSEIVHSTLLPNLFGHYTQEDAEIHLQNFTYIADTCPVFKLFLCSLYFPSCPDDDNLSFKPSLVLPCRPLCELARRDYESSLKSRGNDWPHEFQCQNFPTEKCIQGDGKGGLSFVTHSLQAQFNDPFHMQRSPIDLAPLDAEVDEHGGDYNVEVVTLEEDGPPRRRYDIVDLGNESYFRGWADVQGSGAANDYCRVIGRNKRKFLSCALAGTVGQDHRYVSELGFVAGYQDTWFMRDVDNDGRDDYCRCVGKVENSRISCMKAGKNGFYGSNFEGGSQFTFDLPGSSACHDKPLNPFFGA